MGYSRAPIEMHAPMSFYSNAQELATKVPFTVSRITSFLGILRGLTVVEEPRLVEETATHGGSKTHGETTTRNFTSYCTEELKQTQTHAITLETTTYATSRSNSH